MDRTVFMAPVGILLAAAVVTAAGPAGGGAARVGATWPAPVAVKDLPEIKQMPDPMVMNDGTKVTTAEQWKKRRVEMMKIMEDYEYGHMPPAPGNVKGTVTVETKVVTVGGGRGGFGAGGAGPGRAGVPGRIGGAATGTAPATGRAGLAGGAAGGVQANYKMVHLTFGPGEKLGFDLGIFTPIAAGAASEPAAAPGKGYAALMNMGFGAGETSAVSCIEALRRGYAVVSIPAGSLGADNVNYRSTGFFPAYPEYDWNDFSAWAWGISRAVDYLVTDPVIDKDKLMVTGTSRYGQAALLAGAFDERIAMTAPVAGGMALRFSGKEMGDRQGQGIAEVVDQQTYWFGPRYAEFKGHTLQLPCDQHWLPALTAPRLFIMCNSLGDQYGNPVAAAQTYYYAKPVYDFLKAPDSIGVNFRAGGHGMQAEDWSSLMDFADEKLMGKPAKRKFDVMPEGYKKLTKE